MSPHVYLSYEKRKGVNGGTFNGGDGSFSDGANACE
jgi:hypothetical protein